MSLLGLVHAECPEPDIDNSYKIVSVRLRHAEFETLSQAARTIGVTNNMAVRIAVRKIGGFLEIDNETRYALDAITIAIGAVSTNLSRIGSVASGGTAVDMQALTEQRRAFAREFRCLDALLRNILNTTRRRSDGRAMLPSDAGP